MRWGDGCDVANEGEGYWHSEYNFDYYKHDKVYKSFLCEFLSSKEA